MIIPREPAPITVSAGSPVSMGEGLNPERLRVSSEDKLRLIRDTVEAQTPFGTELANFQRRLRIVLDL